LICRGFHKEDEFKRRFNHHLNLHMSADSLFRLSTRYHHQEVAFQDRVALARQNI
jgi:hypothetical protein